MCNTSAGTLLVKDRRKAKFFLNGTLCGKRNPLIRVDEGVFSIIKKIIFLTEDNCRSFCGYALNIERISIGELVLNCVQNLENLTCKLNSLIGITYTTELVSFRISECFDYLEQSENTDCTILLIHFNRTILVVGEQSLFYVALDNVSYSVKSLAAKQCSLFEKFEILLFVTLRFESNSHKVNCVHLNRADRQSRSADRVDKAAQLRGIGKKSATVTQSGYIVAHKEIAIVPKNVMVGTPSCKIIINKHLVILGLNHMLNFFLGQITSFQE